MALTVKDLAKMIDHSLLHPTMDDTIIKDGCELAVKYDTASVCLKPYSVKTAAGYLKGSDVKCGSVIGFPHGNSTTEIKVAETLQAIKDGAVEIDMVITIGKALGGDWQFVQDDISAVNKAATDNGAILKVIFENDYLEDDHIIKLCEICNDVNVAFVKTSSGYGFTKRENGMYNYNGATAHHLKLMRKHTADHIEVKAAGGIRTLPDMLYARTLGVTRIGATATAPILEEAGKVLASGKTLEEITPSTGEQGGSY